MGNMSFYDRLTGPDKKVVQRLAEIEKEDYDRCSNCGGEDCVCCNIYWDRQRWKSPEELFPYAVEPLDLIPDRDSDEYLDWCAINDYEPEDEDNYTEFCGDYLRDLMEYDYE